MNTPKHTPGPICTCGVITAVIETGIGCYGENEIAQCPLCKAAPAMYEALGELIAYLRNNVADEALDNWAPVLKAAYALAQAEGSKP
jgi:hypothetical protein